MRIVLDAGILVRSHEGKDGLGRQLLLTLIEANHTLLLSRPILYEVGKVLRYPRLQKSQPLTEGDIYRYVSFLCDVAEMVVLDTIVPVPIRDVNDIVVAQTAILGMADLLCTVDEDFYGEEVRSYLSRLGITVISDIDLIHRLRI